MAVFDFTLIQSMLGNEVCFIDKELDALIPIHHKYNHHSYVYGFVNGFSCDLDKDGDLVFFILVNGNYYHILSIDILMLS